MTNYVPAIILLFCAPAFFVEERMVRPIFVLSGIAFLIGALALAWSFLMPANFLVEHPALADSPLHPVMAGLFGGVLLLFGTGLLLALGSRYLWRHFRAQRGH